jgi:hypothetical protein
VFLENLPMVRRTLFCRCWSFIRCISAANSKRDRRMSIST